MRIDSNGNVGIGITNPTQKLYVSGNAVVDGDVHLETAGDCITFYGDCNGRHGITSRDCSGVVSDDLRINTYGSLFINLDSNNNNSSNADFIVARHGNATGTMSTPFFCVHGETGNATAYGDLFSQDGRALTLPVSETTSLSAVRDGIYKWGSTAPNDAPDDYGWAISLTDGNQPNQLVQTYGGATNKMRLFGRRKTNGTWDTSWTEYWSNANDGAGSGLDADLLDGANSSMSGAAGCIARYCDTNGYLYANSWVYTGNTTGIFAGCNSAHFFPNTDGDYGTWQINGNKGGWSGIHTCGGTFMVNQAGSVMGLYNDTNNEWILKGTFNGATELFHNGVSKLTTLSTGIKVSSSGQVLSVLGSTDGSRALFVLDGAANGDGSGGDYAYLSHNADGSFDIKNLQDNSINLATGASGTTRMTITSAGNVGIGSTVPAAKLDVAGDACINSVRVGRGKCNVSNNTAVGTDALDSATGECNTGLGYQALINNTTGCRNTAVGSESLLAATSGYFNTAIGVVAGCNNTANQTVAVGYASLRTNSASNNVAVGICALYSNSGLRNTALGFNVFRATNSGCDNIGAGYESLKCNSSGCYNAAYGSQSLCKNTTGDCNTALGYRSLYFNTTGVNNTAVGSNALYCNTGNYNTAVGSDSLQCNTTGTNNASLGYRALQRNTTGSQNTAMGFCSLYANVTGSNNTSLGYMSLQDNTGGANTAIGRSSLQENTTGHSNTAVGYMSLRDNTVGRYNTAIGNNGLRDNTSGERNTAVGLGAMLLNESGCCNTAIGMYAAYYGTTAYNNTAIGYTSLFCITTGNENTATGMCSLRKTNTGSGNVATGYRALACNTEGISNTAIGRCAGCNITTGSCNIFIGAYTEGGSVSDSNAIAIGYDVNTCGSNTINIGNSLNTKTIFEYGNVGIGTDNPTAKLHIADSGGDVKLIIDRTDARTYSIYTESNGSLRIKDEDASTDRISILSGGNVGIGTDDPDYKLHTVGGAGVFDVTGAATLNHHLAVTEVATLPDWRPYSGTTTAALQIQSSATRGILLAGKSTGNQDFYNTDGLDIYVGSTVGSSSSDTGTLAMSILSGGNVGIGTDSPNDKLEIHGNMRVRGSDGFGANSTASYNPSFVAYPGGGKIGSSSSPVTGYIKITLPQSWTSTMMQFSVDIFEYSNNKAKTFVLAGYNYSSSSRWINTSAMVLAGDDGTTYKVQFGHDGSKCAIYISKGSAGASSSWTYPYVVVRDASFGFLNTGISNWIDGWSVSFPTSLGTITETKDVSTQVTGSGTSQYITKWNSTGTELDDSVIVQDSNNIGIGTNGPEGKLHIYTGNSGGSVNTSADELVIESASTGGIQLLNGSTASGYILFGDSGGNSTGQIRYLHSDDSMRLYTSGTERMQIDSDGNVGIGTDDPRGPLEVYAASDSTLIVEKNKTNGIQLRADNSVDSAISLDFEAYEYNFKNGSGTSRLLIDSSGNVGINTTNPTHPLTVDGNILQCGGHSLYSHGNVGWHRQGYDIGGAGPSNGANITLNDIHGETACTLYHYKIHLTTTNTGTDSGSTWLGIYDNDTSTWSTRPVSRSDGSSNHPQLSASGSNFIAYHNHASANYDIHARVETLYKADSDGTGHSIGADFHWQRLSSDLYYLDGNVGIGTDDPGELLEVDGNIKLGDGDTRDIIGPANNSLRIVANPNATNEGIIFSTDGGSTTEMFIQDGGNVGIGTTDPDQKLHVVGKALITNDIQLTGSNPRIDFNTNGSSALRFYDTTNTAERMRIDSSGNVGIGTTAPKAKFEVDLNQTSGTLAADNYAHFGGQHHTNGSVMGITLGYREANLLYRKVGIVARGLGDTQARQDLDFLVSTVNGSASVTPADAKLTISGTTGNVGIGTTDPTRKLEIRGDVRVMPSSGDVKITLTDSGVRNWDLRVSDGADYFEIDGTTSTSLVVTGAGNVGIGTTNPSAKLHVAGNTFLNSGANVWNLIGNNGINFARETSFGYSSTYRILQLGTVESNKAISIGVDVSSNASGSFGGDEIIFPNQREIITPNAADDGFLGLIATDNQNKVRIGNYRWNILNDTPGITIDTSASTNYVGIGTTDPSYKLDIGGDTSSTSNTLRLYQADGGTAIRIGAGSGGSDVTLLRVDGHSSSNAGSSDSGQYGWSIKYNGTGSDNLNTLSINADNCNAGSQVEAISFTQNGSVGIGTNEAGTNVELGVKSRVDGTNQCGVLALYNYNDAKTHTFISTYNSSVPGAAAAQIVVSNPVNSAQSSVVLGANNSIGGYISMQNNAGVGQTLISTSPFVATVFNEGGQDTDFRVEAVSSGSTYVADKDYALFVDASAGAVGIGTSQPSYALEVDGTAHINGTFTADTKSFLIDHPTKEGYMLRYGCLEGPEHAVYVRGTGTTNKITLPDYWIGLIDEDSITVTLTSRGKFIPLFVEDTSDTEITVGGLEVGDVYDYIVHATRRDVDPLEVEFLRPVQGSN